MPDLNTVPASPHVLASTSRRTSGQQMPPPAIPSSPSLNILPSNQNTVNQAPSTSLPSPPLPPSAILATPAFGDNAGVGPGPGPIRHPRPMTAADLHLELEKEQEAVVNRLTRELTLLRAAQNASVVSNASSTSASASGAESSSIHVADPQQHLTGGFSHPLTSSRRHHRSLSNTSNRSLTANAGSISATSLAGGISAPAPIRPGSNHPIATASGGTSLSRQNSISSRRSRNASPAPPHHLHTPSHHLADPASSSSYFGHRNAPTSAPAGGGEQLSPGLLPATSRYEETAYYRAELDSAKRENEALKRRVRELERMVRDGRDRASSSSSRPVEDPRARSDSVSTAASAVSGSVTGGAGGGGASITAQRERPSRVVSMLSATGSVGVGVPEDEVRVGESAASAGLRVREADAKDAKDQEHRGAKDT